MGTTSSQHQAVPAPAANGGANGGAVAVPQQRAGTRHSARNVRSPMSAETGEQPARGRGRVRSASFPPPAGSEEGTASAELLLQQTSSNAQRPTSSGQTCWCVIKAKTRQHSSSRVSRRVVWFEAKEDNTFSVGRNANCNLRLDDDRCEPINAMLEPVMQDGVPGVIMSPKARMYQLVGKGAKKFPNCAEIRIGSVIKVGSVSLEVTGLSTKEGDDFVERFAVEIGGGGGGPSRRSSRPRSARSSTGRQTVANGGTAAAGAAGKQLLEKADDGNGASNHEAESEGSQEGASQVDEDGVAAAIDDDGETLADDENDASSVEDDEDAMCYICWGGLDGPISEEAATPADADAGGAEEAKSGSTEPALPKANPLIQNPCGKCSGSSRYVHLNCLLKWIKSSGSGHCSICNGPLPQHFSWPPPNLELKVVRHRRGQHWVGTRRFRLSFTDRDQAIIGRDSEADVHLSDRSVGNKHAIINFDRETRTFTISDRQSLGGTFLKVDGAMQLEPENPLHLKIGRTELSLRVTQRKGTLLNMLQGLSWAKR